MMRARVLLRQSTTRSLLIKTQLQNNSAIIWERSSCRSASSINSRTSSTKTGGPQRQDDETPLSTLGFLFFGSLCAGTFGLGCWQTQRYFEKVEAMNIRTKELSLPSERLPARNNNNNNDFALDVSPSSAAAAAAPEAKRSFKRFYMDGKFDHKKALFVGPRGPPPGALAMDGPASGRSSGGMSSGPQGYYIVTPFHRTDTSETVLVNRGWIPHSFIKNHGPKRLVRNDTNKNLDWDKPEGTIQIFGIQGEMEKPRFLSPPHDENDLRTLLWMDRMTIEDRTGTVGSNPTYFIETLRNHDDDNNEEETHHTNIVSSFPVRPDAQGVGEFKVTPPVHAGYAATWFGLSGAGVIMTRKLMTRGRG